jgi:aldehyde dehydrogenase (NAD(P)+)
LGYSRLIVTIAPTTSADLDESLAVLSEHKDEWARLAIGERIRLLDSFRRRSDFAARRWVEASVAAKGLADPNQAGEEWLSGPYAVLSAASALTASLERIARGKTTYKARWVSVGSNGRTIVKALPVEWFEPLLFSGYRLDIWMEPTVTPANLADHTASFYRIRNPKGRVCGILGAGNVAAIPPLDALHKLYVEGQVVALKLNPVNQYLGPIFEEIFRDFIERGWLRVLYGGPETGTRLVGHPQVDTLHITGSAATHDLIVFGSGAEGKERRIRNAPLLQKPLTSELGGVSPFIVVPGPWTDADLRFQAENFVTQKLLNGGFNCIAAQVLVLSDPWESSNRFLEHVHRVIAEQPKRPAFYPAGEARRAAVASRPGAVTLGASPCTHLRDVDWSDSDLAFTEEFFSAAFVSTSLPMLDPAEFLDASVDFANQRLDGTLGAVIIVHPATARELGDRLEKAIGRLRYGAVGINVWTAFNFLQPRGSWGAFPGHSLSAIGSGIGSVHNGLMFDRPEKSVTRGPFRPIPRAWAAGEFHLSPKPPWYLTSRTGADTSERFTRFTADHSPRHLPGLFASALRG